MKQPGQRWSAVDLVHNHPLRYLMAVIIVPALIISAIVWQIAPWWAAGASFLATAVACWILQYFLLL